MTTTPEQIDLWRKPPSEHQRLEFKEAKKQFDNRKLNEYCVALANEGGGYLLLGIADKPLRAEVGTRAFADAVVMAKKLFQAVGFRVDIELVMPVMCRFGPECALTQTGGVTGYDFFINKNRYMSALKQILW